MLISEQLDWALLLTERSYGLADVPGVFWLATNIGKRSEKEMSGLASGVLKGLRGIGGDKGVVLSWLGIGRNALLIMPGKETVKENKLTRVMYGKPEYLVSNNCAALYRIWDKNPDKPYGRDAMMGNLIDYIRPLLMQYPHGTAFYTIGHAMDYGHLSRHEYGKRFAEKTPTVNTIKDLAVWLKKTTRQILEKEAKRFVPEADELSAQTWYLIVSTALEKVGATYRSEGEWIVKGDTFKIPSGSKLLMLKPDEVTQEMIEKRRAGEKGIPVARGAVYFFGDLDEVWKYGLDKKYEIKFVPQQKFEQQRVKLMTQR